MTAPGRDGQFHATAIVLGTTGFLVTGRSGAGKSALALRLLSAARQAGKFAGLVADDQVFLSVQGGRIVARAPASIAGSIECRGSGIAAIPWLGRALIHRAIAPAAASGADRVPETGERFEIGPGAALPLLRLRYDDPEPFATLSVLVARI